MEEGGFGLGQGVYSMLTSAILEVSMDVTDVVVVAR